MDTERSETCKAGFVLFLLVNATLFLRPAEIIEDLASLPIFLWLILAALAASLPAVIDRLRWRSLREQPAVLCVLMMLPAIVLSHLAHRDLYWARMDAWEFLKVLIYYVLLVALVDSPQRLRTFAVALAIFITLAAALALLQQRGLITLNSLSALERVEGVNEYGEQQTLTQLRGAGIFRDPNDFSLILVTGIMIVVHFTLNATALSRILLAAPAAILTYAFALTNSRGGFLSLLAGAITMIVARWGWKRAIPLSLLALPAMLFLFEGRQTSMNLTDESDTAQGRIMIWRDGLAEFKAAPIFGIGRGAYDEHMGHTAHNSFVLCYTELGMIGGTAFLGAFFLPALVIRKYPRGRRASGEVSEVVCWRACIAAILAAYGVGLFSLSRSYTMSTYTIFGLTAAYCRLLAQQDPLAVAPLTAALIKRLAMASVACVVFLMVFVRVLAR